MIYDWLLVSQRKCMPKTNSSYNSQYRTRGPASKQVQPTRSKKPHHIVSQKSPDLWVSRQEIHEQWRMRWWFFKISFFLSVLSMLAVIALCWHVFDVTKSLPIPLISVALAPLFILIRQFAKYLLVHPMDNKQYNLEIMRIEARTGRHSVVSTIIEKSAPGSHETKRQV